MARRAGVSETTVERIWKSFDLKPHLSDGFKLSSDPLFIEKGHPPLMYERASVTICPAILRSGPLRFAYGAALPSSRMELAEPRCQGHLKISARSSSEIWMSAIR
jgi:hypothetical protein